jgi:hypothetical protein
MGGASATPDDDPMLNSHHIQRRLFALVLAAALCLPATASAMPVIDTGPVVTPTPATPAGSNDALLLASGVLAVFVLTGVTFRVRRTHRVQVRA